jgi:hypothetical protein
VRESYALVGVTERMAQTQWVLSRQLPAWFPPSSDDAADAQAHDAAAVRLNAARGGARAEAARQLTPVRAAAHDAAALHVRAQRSLAGDACFCSSLAQAVAAQLRALNAYDWRLYVMARALLERHAAACAAEEAAERATAAH